MKKISILKSKIHGRGIFAAEYIKRAERIQYIRGKRAMMKTRNKKDSKEIAHWIGLGRFSWIRTEGTPFRYINHSCDPNAAIMGTKTLIALKDIDSGEEITIDYSMTDADPHWSIKCKCGSKECRKYIRAIYTVPPEVFERHLPYIPKFFRKLYIRKRLRQKKVPA